MENEKFIATTELAKLFGVSRSAVFKKIKSNRIEAGRNYIIDKNNLPDTFRNCFKEIKE